MKTTLLLSSAMTGLLLCAGQAMAQDPTTPTPLPLAFPPAVEQPEDLRLEPGSVIHSSDDAELGWLVTSRRTATGQLELVVRGKDGRYRAVPAENLTEEGRTVTVGWTDAQFQAAPILPPPS